MVTKKTIGIIQISIGIILLIGGIGGIIYEKRIQQNYIEDVLVYSSYVESQQGDYEAMSNESKILHNIEVDNTIDWMYWDREFS